MPSLTPASLGNIRWFGHKGLLCGALMTLATPTALLLGVLLGPAMLAVVLDREPWRPTGRSVALFSMAASV